MLSSNSSNRSRESNAQGVLMRALLSVFTISVFFVSVGHVQAQGKVYALFVFDTDINGYRDGKFNSNAAYNLRSAAKVNRTLVLRAFVESFNHDKRRHRLEYVVLDGKRATKDAILEYYANLVCKPEDTLFFYSFSHGAVDSNRGHYLDLTRGSPLFRSDLRGAMLYQKGRQKIIVTDCCSSYIDSDRTLPGVARAANWDIMTQLMFKWSGFVDITAATPGQTAVAHRNLGGYFTESFVHNLCSSLDHVDGNSSGAVTWSELFSKTSDRVRDHHNRKQRQHVFYNGNWPKQLQERKLLIRNNSQHTLDLYVRYLTNDSSGNWNWFGSRFDSRYRPTGGTSWTIAPGKKTYLKDGDFRVRGYKFYIYAKSRERNTIHWPAVKIDAVDPRFPAYYSDDGNFETIVKGFK